MGDELRALYPTGGEVNVISEQMNEQENRRVNFGKSRIANDPSLV